MPYQYANFAETTLSADITNSATSLTIADATNFPSSGNFPILIDQELLLCTAITGTTLTVTRAQEGTSAVVHLSGATVSSPLTKAALQGLAPSLQLSNLGGTAISGPVSGDSLVYNGTNFANKTMNLSGTLAARPAASMAGRLYYQTDGPFVWRDTGSAWVMVQAGMATTVNDPANFTWTQNGSGTGITTGAARGGYQLATTTAATTGANMYAAVPGSTPWTMTFYILGFIAPLQFAQIGLIGRDTTGGANNNKAVNYLFQGNGTSGVNGVFTLQYNRLDASLAYVSTPSTAATYAILPLSFGAFYLQFADDGTNRKFNYSTDGITFVTVPSFTETRTTYCTVDKVGVTISPGVTNTDKSPASAWLLSCWTG